MNPRNVHLPSFRIATEVRTGISRAQLAHFEIADMASQVMSRPVTYRFDFSVTARPASASACFPSRDSTRRFHRLGPVYMVPPYEPVLFLSDTGRSISVVCEIDPQAVNERLEKNVVWETSALKENLDLRNTRIRELLCCMNNELSHPSFAQEVVIESISVLLAVEATRSWLRSRERVGGLSARRLRLIDERIAMLGPAPSLTELATLTGLSIRHLTRSFRVSRGCPIGAYVAAQRVEQSKQLLLAGKSVKAVARDLKFGSAESFAYAFRRLTGCTPSDFRRRTRNSP